MGTVGVDWTVIREMSVPSSTSDKVGAVQFRHAGRSYHCRFPDVGNLRDIVTKIVSGQAYPLPILKGFRPEVIVDVGANVGASALYFAIIWPEARLFCYEPSSRNLPFLRANLKDLPQARVFDHGLSDRNRQTRLYHGKFQTAQDSTVPSVETGTDFEMIRLRRASDEFAACNLDRISILKIDTEGAECEILCQSALNIDPRSAFNVDPFWDARWRSSR